MKSKWIVRALPELYFLLLIVGVSAGPHWLNPFLIASLAVVLCLLVSRSEILGQIITGIILLVNIYFLFAVIDEFNDFATIEGPAIALITVGLTLIAANFVMNALMFRKYFKP